MAAPAGGMQPPVGPPQPGNALATLVEADRLRELVSLLHTPASDVQGQQSLEQQAEALQVEAILPQLPQQPPPQYGELPGEGYLYAHAPLVRQSALVQTSPEIARAALLRAVEAAAMNAMLPFGEHPPGEWAKATLAFSQAYLLLDPSVDESGVPVGAQAQAQAQGQEGVARAQAEGAAHVARVTKAAEAGHMQDPESFTRAPATGGHAEPPRVQPNAAELAIQKMHEGQEHVLKGARGDRPRPRPRVGE